MAHGSWRKAQGSRLKAQGSGHKAQVDPLGNRTGGTPFCISFGLVTPIGVTKTFVLPRIRLGSTNELPRLVRGFPSLGLIAIGLQNRSALFPDSDELRGKGHRSRLRLPLGP